VRGKWRGEDMCRVISKGGGAERGGVIWKSGEGLRWELWGAEERGQGPSRA
jgi:hypothetical protein